MNIRLIIDDINRTSRRVGILADDFHSHGELLAMLLLPRNIEAILSNKADALSQLYEYIRRFEKNHLDREKAIIDME